MSAETVIGKIIDITGRLDIKPLVVKGLTNNFLLITRGNLFTGAKNIKKQQIMYKLNYTKLLFSNKKFENTLLVPFQELAVALHTIDVVLHL